MDEKEKKELFANLLAEEETEKKRIWKDFWILEALFVVFLLGIYLVLKYFFAFDIYERKFFFVLYLSVSLGVIIDIYIHSRSRDIAVDVSLQYLNEEDEEKKIDALKNLPPEDIVL